MTLIVRLIGENGVSCSGEFESFALTKNDAKLAAARAFPGHTIVTVYPKNRGSRFNWA